MSKALDSWKKERSSTTPLIDWLKNSREALTQTISFGHRAYQRGIGKVSHAIAERTAREIGEMEAEVAAINAEIEDIELGRWKPRRVDEEASIELARAEAGK